MTPPVTNEESLMAEVQRAQKHTDRAMRELEAFQEAARAAQERRQQEEERKQALVDLRLQQESLEAAIGQHVAKGFPRDCAEVLDDRTRCGKPFTSNSGLGLTCARSHTTEV